MKCHIPQISWHNRDPVLSIDCQATEKSVQRIATAGTDTHVFIWLLHLAEKGAIEVEFVADLNRHTRAVNVVRFSPNGEILASGDDEACIILWKLQARDENDIFDDNDETNKEHWVPIKILRGHIDDISDLCWSKDSLSLISASVDNTALVWDIQKGKNVGLMSDHKGFVQGVAWDPVGHYYATISSDRMLRIFSQQSKKVLYKVQKAIIPGSKETNEGTPKASRIFYDDTLKSFCRRLAFSCDGEILVVPSGIIEQDDGKFTNASFVFSRHALNRPVMCLPTMDKFTVAVRCCPVLFTLKSELEGPGKEAKPMSDAIFNLPYRIVFAVATQNAIIVYDSQHLLPIAHISNIHYTRLTDLSWSSDGKILMASSTDGYCSFVIFGDGELGILFKEETPKLSDVLPDKASVPETIGFEENQQDITTTKTLEGCVPPKPDLCNAKEDTTEPIECDEPQISSEVPLMELSTTSRETKPLEVVDEAMVTECADSSHVSSPDLTCSTVQAMDTSTSVSQRKQTDGSSTGKKTCKAARRVQLITLAGR